MDIELKNFDARYVYHRLGAEKGKEFDKLKMTLTYSSMPDIFKPFFDKKYSTDMPDIIDVGSASFLAGYKGVDVDYSPGSLEHWQQKIGKDIASDTLLASRVAFQARDDLSYGLTVSDENHRKGFVVKA